jgi:hypothetical protein
MRVMWCQDFWWGGVAVLSSRMRAQEALCAGGTTQLAAHNSSSSSSKAAELCPSYHTGLAWRIAAREDMQGGRPRSRHGSACLQHLLLREAAGSHPWVLQQLAPHKAAQEAASSRSSSSSSSSNAAPGMELFLGVQWPLLCNVESSWAAPSSSCGCSCRSLTCYLCTPPPPVTLQQLRLVLEVVCLTCTETSREALQAPLLLALLLQRASPGVRAEFLNSADGTRLLVALQQAPLQTEQELRRLTTTDTWCFHVLAGALSGYPDSDRFRQRPVLPPTITKSMLSLTWCFLELDPGAGAAANAPKAAGTGRGVGQPAMLMSPEAVDHGSVLLCVGTGDSQGV